MGSKNKELNCMDKILCNKAVQGDIAHSIQDMIVAMKDTCTESERPDFILVSDDTVLGLEHCLVDSLYNEHTESFSRQNGTDIQHLVDAYAKDNDMDKGVASTKEILLNSFGAIYRFDYKTFVKKFEEICIKHNKKCDEGTDKYPSYKSHLQSMNKTNNVLGCIVEVPIPDVKNIYILTEGNRRHKQRLKNIPFTKDIIRIIKKMKGFDFVIVCAYSQNFTAVTYFDVKNVDLSVKQQRIKIYDSFDYASKIKLEDIVITKNDDSYTFNFKGRL